MPRSHFDSSPLRIPAACCALALALAALRLTGLAQPPWWLVTAPLWLPVLAYLMLAVAVVAVVLWTIPDARKGRK